MDDVSHLNSVTYPREVEIREISDEYRYAIEILVSRETRTANVDDDEVLDDRHELTFSLLEAAYLLVKFGYPRYIIGTSLSLVDQYFAEGDTSTD